MRIPTTFLYLASLLLMGWCPASDPVRVLIIGDSISIGYTPFLKSHFAGRAVVEHNPGNAQHTGTGLAKLESWLGDDDWDIVQFNWGLWDLCYRHPDSPLYGNRDKVKGEVTFPVDEYRANLERIVKELRRLTDAKLLFVTTTYVPPEEAGRFAEDAPRYNDAARAVMAEHDVEVNDIYALSREIHAAHGIGPDDVHYTEEGYRALSRPLIERLEQIMENRF